MGSNQSQLTTTDLILMAATQKAAAKNIVQYPPPPEMVTRIQFIKYYKNQTYFSKSDEYGNTRYPCPHCDNNIPKEQIIGCNLSNALHFDTCPTLETLWLQRQQDQKTAMFDWVNVIKMLKQCDPANEDSDVDDVGEAAEEGA